MNYSEAIKILNLKEDFENKDLKRSYYKEALKHHPDKTNGDDEKFKQIVNAYEYLLKYKNIENNEEYNKKDYLSIIKNFIKSTFPNLNDNQLDDNLQNILFTFKNLSLKALKNIPRDDLLKLYTFIYNNHDIFGLNNVLLERLLELIKSNININNTIILNPDIDDLLNDNVFCLNLENNDLLIPLWHDNVEFDLSNNDINIINIPNLNKNIAIDKYNNINIEITIDIKRLLEDDLTFNLGKKKFTIKSNELKISKNQIYILKEKGMLKINKDDLFDTNYRGDINVMISLL